MNKLFYLSILVFFLFSCQSGKTEKERQTSEKKTRNEVPPQISNSFFEAVKGLENQGFIISGEDSVIITKDSESLPELSSLRFLYYTPYDSTDAGEKKFKTYTSIEKYRVKKIGDRVKNVSANIIQFSFKSNQAAFDWYLIYNNSPHKLIVQNKPKTSLWIQEDKVYFVQTYNTPAKDVLRLLESSLKENLKEN